MRPAADSPSVWKDRPLAPAFAVGRTVGTHTNLTAGHHELEKVMIEDTTAGGVL